LVPEELHGEKEEKGGCEGRERRRNEKEKGGSEWALTFVVGAQRIRRRGGKENRSWSKPVKKELKNPEAWTGSDRGGKVADRYRRRGESDGDFPKEKTDAKNNQKKTKEKSNQKRKVKGRPGCGGNGANPFLGMPSRRRDCREKKTHRQTEGGEGGEKK